jgi:hypothetical protein
MTNTENKVVTMSDFDFLRGVQSSLIEHKTYLTFEVKKWEGKEDKEDKFFLEMFQMFQKQLEEAERNLEEVTRRLSENAKSKK